jgi:hypothetical protein
MSSPAAAKLDTGERSRPRYKADQVKALKSNGKFKCRTRGYVAIPFVHGFYNLPRLSASKTQMSCILYVLSETLSAARPEGAPPPKESKPLSSEGFQWYCQESMSTVQHALQDLVDREVIPRREATAEDFAEYHTPVPASLRGWYCYSLPLKTWNDLPDHEPAEKKPPVAAENLDSRDSQEDSDSEEETGKTQGEETANPRCSRLHLVSGIPPDEPLRLRPKQPSKAFEPPVPIEKVQFSSDGDVDIHPVIQRGVLRISIHLGIPAGGREPGHGAGANIRRNPAAAGCSEKNGSGDSGRVTKNSPAGFGVFLAAGTRAGLPASREDWNEAERLWKSLGTAERLLAIQGIEKRIQCGEFAEFAPRPDNYLKKRAWERPLRPAKGRAGPPDTEARIRSAQEKLRNLGRRS